MKPSDSVYVGSGRSIAIVGGMPPVPLGSLPSRIVKVLAEKNMGLTGSQLARELDVTPAAIMKAASELIDLGIIRKEPLPVAKNVKLYFLAVTIIDEERIKQLRSKLPAIVLKLIKERFEGNEDFATVIVGQLLDYVGSLPDSNKVLEQLLSEMVKRKDGKTAQG